MFWCSVIMVALSLNEPSTPVLPRACFYAIEENFLAAWLTLDYVSDLFYMADMAVRGRTGNNGTLFACTG